MQASGAASMAMELLASARNTRTVKKKYPEEHDVTDEEPRIGVFVCHCGRNIGSVIDVERVAKTIEAEPGVVLATHTMFTCSDTSLSNIRADRGASAQPHRGRVLYAADARAAVPRDDARGRAQSVPLRNGQHPRPMLLGPFRVARDRHAEGDGAGQDGGGTVAAAVPVGAGHAGRRSERSGHRWRPGGHDRRTGPRQPGLQGPSGGADAAAGRASARHSSHAGRTRTSPA